MSACRNYGAGISAMIRIYVNAADIYYVVMLTYRWYCLRELRRIDSNILNRIMSSLFLAIILIAIQILEKSLKH